MEAYRIRLEGFEGPLALLLHLIEKSKLDIYNIPIADVTVQYLAYLREMEEFNMEIASEFLLMAATLLQIKSRLLLPVAAVEEEEEEGLDPRKELVDRLLEYRRFKMLAQLLGERWQLRQGVFTRPSQLPEPARPLPAGLTPQLLLQALTALWESRLPQTQAVVEREEISIQDKMADVVRLLQERRCVPFEDLLIRSGSRGEVIASFLAVLELVRLQRVRVRQLQSFGPMEIILSCEEEQTCFISI